MLRRTIPELEPEPRARRQRLRPLGARPRRLLRSDSGKRVRMHERIKHLTRGANRGDSNACKQSIHSPDTQLKAVILGLFALVLLAGSACVNVIVHVPPAVASQVLIANSNGH